jgi:uncharacterized oxidoreductase
MPAPRGPLDMSSFFPVITGGASGIGLSIAKHLLAKGCPKVLLTDINAENLEKAKEELGADKVHTIVNDVTKEDDRVALLEWVKSNHDDCNALVNNAGLERAGGASDNPPWSALEFEIALNLSGPIHLCRLFMPYFLAKPGGDCAIINNTSTLAFIPYVGDPVYSATKSGLHAYTESIRYLLEDTHVRVCEIFAGAVKTPLLAKSPFANDPSAVSCDDFCEHIVGKLEEGVEELTYDIGYSILAGGRDLWKQIMLSIANGISVPKYEARSS